MRIPNRALFLFVVSAATIASPELLSATRETEGSSATRSASRVVTSGPGYEIRADERNYYRRVLVPLTTTQSPALTVLPEEFATTGTTAPAPGSWQPFPLYGGNVTAIAVSPIDPNYVLAGIEEGEGGASGNLYESKNGGLSWSRLESPISRSYFKSYVHDIEFAPDGTAYVASEYRALRRAPDTGEWTALKDYFGEYFFEVSVNPADPSEIWLGGYDGWGSLKPEVLRSRDGGSTWVNVAPAVGYLIPSDIAFSTKEPGVVVVSFSYNTGELWRTGDSGATWTKETTLTNSVFTDVVYDGSRFWASAERWTQGGVYMSSDEGLTWGRMNNGSWPSNQVFDLAVDPLRPGVVLAATARGICRCADLTWTFQLGGTNKKSHSAAFFPGDPTRILAAQESDGIARSVDGGASFHNVSEGLLGLYLQGVAQNPVNPLEITVTFQAFNTGGVVTSLDGGQTWKQDYGVTARMGDVAYGPDGTLYVVSLGPAGGDPAISREGVHRRNANGTWKALGPGIVSNLYDDEIGCIRVDPLDPATVFITSNHWPDDTLRIWRSTNRGDSWTTVLSRDVSAGTIWFTGGIEFVNDGGDKKLLGVLSNGEAFHSGDDGITWSPIAGLSSNNQGSFLRGTPADSKTFYLVPYGRQTGYATRDGGDTWSPFEAGGLSRFSTDISDPNVLYAQRSGEIIRSRDGGSSFALFGEGAPWSIAHDFAWAQGPCPTLLLATSVGLYGRTIDSVAPQISLELEPNVLWPPDHKLKTITARVTTLDVCDAGPTFALKSIAMTDVNGAPGDVVAHIGEGTTTFQLRAERSGKGDRRYLVTYTATDASGNVSEATAAVLVPHDHSGIELAGDPAPRNQAPAKTELVSIEPNPFNPSTSAMITLAAPGQVALDVYDVRGAHVRTLVAGTLPAGAHRIAWDGTDQHGRPAASGVYFLRFVAGHHVQTMKALLIK